MLEGPNHLLEGVGRTLSGDRNDIVGSRAVEASPFGG
jgi:hypothetical protein